MNLTDTTSTQNRPSKSTDGRAKPRPGLDIQRRLILDTAVDLFVQDGSQAVSISQICEHADISRPTFYRCFEDKEALVSSLYEVSVFEPVQQILLQELAIKGNDPYWLRHALDQLLDSIFENAHYAELVFIESSNPRSPAHTIISKATDQAAEVIQAWVTAEDGSTLNTRFLKAIMAACQWLVHDAIRAGLSDEEKIQTKEATWKIISTLLTTMEAQTQ